MAIKIDQPSEAGEYDDGMQALLQVIWGEGFLSPGGAEEVALLLEGEDIGELSVLDVGCGLGAVDELLVLRHGARSVVGVDIDPALLAQMDVRMERAGIRDRVRNVRVEPGPLPFSDGEFAVVFSKDAFVQIPDKPAIYAEAYRVLQPGGRFIASDWLRGGKGAYSAEMLEFFRLEGVAYSMVSLEESAEALRGAGFRDVKVLDRNAWYRALARRELDSMAGQLRPLILTRIGPERTAHFIENWRQLVKVLDRGVLRPGHLRATKPS
jgi:ubiquinone/menaquinone biosynthesis C-methylase UbiE